MFNILLDPLPTEYKGWLIRTDYRIGMQIALALSDRTLSESDRAAVAFRLLFGNGIPDIATATAALKWYMAGGADLREDLPPDNSPPSFYYDFDAGRIWASFRATYGIDLHTANMHWFEFLYLLSSVGKDTSFSNAMEIRNVSTKGMKGREREKVIRSKMALTPPVEETEAEKAETEMLRNEMESLMGGR